MALADYVPECRPVLVNGKTLTSVEGLSFEALAVLVKTHMPDFDAIFEIIESGEKPLETFMEHLQRVSQNIVTQAPGLAANIIAQAAVEPTTEAAISAARRLPFPVQVAALMDIGSLTFEEVGGVKKAMESMTALLLRLRTKPLKEPQKADSQSETPRS